MQGEIPLGQRRTSECNGDPGMQTSVGTKISRGLPFTPYTGVSLASHCGRGPLGS